MNKEICAQTTFNNQANGSVFYKEGQLITYTVDEDSVPENYTQEETTSEDLLDDDGNVIGKSYTINNKHEVEKTFRTIFTTITCNIA